ncbi:MAG: hypothetical protein JWQ35_1247 [Bacteriovoracaceae bacterium]|nr:hypothetical protein [Bacteriovoracaceae bacterium]
MITHLPSGRIVAKTVEYMDSSRKRARGLLKYKSPLVDFAAIFKLPFFGFFPLVHTFKMKFAIDIFFCDHEKRVIKKFSAISPGRLIMPWKYFFGGCRYLIEFSESQVSEIKTGDQLAWDDQSI